MIQIGDKVRFTPTANIDHSAGFPDVLAVEVEGTVVQINEEHRWYRVRCELPTGYIFHECFHAEYHWLFYRLQDMYNSDLLTIKNEGNKIKASFEAANIEYEKMFTEGGHTWMNARTYLAETLQKFFK